MLKSPSRNDTGYNAILISTIVDADAECTKFIAGYNAILISTIVDASLPKSRQLFGYNAILISTIVDRCERYSNCVLAIMLF